MQKCIHLKSEGALSRLISCPTTSVEAVGAPSISLDRCSATETIIFLRYLMRHTTSVWLRHGPCDLPQLLIEATGVALRTVALAATSVGVVAVIAASIASSTSTNRHRDALDDAIGRGLPWPLPRVISVIGREVSTNHIRLHRSTISSQLFRCIWHVGTVFSVVDSDLAVEAVSILIGLVVRVRPMTTLANAYGGAGVSVIYLIEA